MPVAEILDGKIAVRTQYHERHLVQQIPGARYNKDAGYWTVPLSWATCITLRGVFGSDLATGTELTKWSWKVYNNRIKPAMDLRSAMELSPDDPVARAIDRVERRVEGLDEAA